MNVTTERVRLLMQVAEEPWRSVLVALTEAWANTATWRRRALTAESQLPVSAAARQEATRQAWEARAANQQRAIELATAMLTQMELEDRMQEIEVLRWENERMRAGLREVAEGDDTAHDRSRCRALLLELEEEAHLRAESHAHAG